MGPHPNGRERYAVLKIVGIYALFGGLWIYLSDTLLALLIRQPGIIARISIFKGFLFILLTSVLLYKLIKRYAGQSALSRQQALETEQRFETIYNFANDAIFIHDAATGRILDVNETMCRMYGWSHAEALDLAVNDLSSGESPYSQFEALQLLSHAGEGRPQLFEWLSRKKDGSLFWTEVSMRRALVGGEERIIVLVRDITERKRSQELIRLSEERYRRFTSLTSDFVYLCVSRNGEPYRIQWIGGASESITGFSPEELLDMGCWQHLTHPDDRERLRAELERLTPGWVTENEFRIITRDGEVRWLRDISRCEAGTEPGELQLHGAFQDISERRRYEDDILKMNRELEENTRQLEENTRQLEEANRELEAFSYSLSHDLRTYITRISTSAQVLEDCGPDSAHAGYCIESIEDSCQGMEDLISSMLKLSLISRSELAREKVNLSAIVNEIGAALRSAEPDRQVEFIVEPGLCAECDPHLIKVALENLVKNAWKYSSSIVPARIEFGREGEGDEKVFRVRDNGPGFDMSEADKLFKPFQRLKNAKDVLGTGIGLATVQRIIQRHDGKVWGAGEIDRGATFYFTLP
jgi:PAS domain S-box-containing protein